MDSAKFEMRTNMFKAFVFAVDGSLALAQIFITVKFIPCLNIKQNNTYFDKQYIATSFPASLVFFYIVSPSEIEETTTSEVEQECVLIP